MRCSAINEFFYGATSLAVVASCSALERPARGAIRQEGGFVVVGGDGELLVGRLKREITRLACGLQSVSRPMFGLRRLARYAPLHPPKSMPTVPCFMLTFGGKSLSTRTPAPSFLASFFFFCWYVVFRARAARPLGPESRVLVPQHRDKLVAEDRGTSLITTPELRGTDDRFVCASQAERSRIRGFGAGDGEQIRSNVKQARKILPSCIGLGDCMLAA